MLRAEAPAGPSAQSSRVAALQIQAAVSDTGTCVPWIGCSVVIVGIPRTLPYSTSLLSPDSPLHAASSRLFSYRKQPFRLPGRLHSPSVFLLTSVSQHGTLNTVDHCSAIAISTNRNDDTSSEGSLPLSPAKHDNRIHRSSPHIPPLVHALNVLELNMYVMRQDKGGLSK